MTMHNIYSEKYDTLCDIIYSLSLKERNKILVLITYAEDSRRVLECMRRHGLYDRFQLVFFNNHNVDPVVTYQNERLLDGAISFRAYVHYLEQFYAVEKVIENLKGRDREVVEAVKKSKAKLAYWESRNRCYAASGFNKRHLFDRECTFGANETLEPKRGWEKHVSEKMPFFFIMMYRMVRLLETFFDKHCEYDPDLENWSIDCNRSRISEGGNHDIWKRKFIATMMESVGDSLNFNDLTDQTTFFVDNTRYDAENQTLVVEEVFEWSIWTNGTLGHNPSFFIQNDIYKRSFIQYKDPWWGNVSRYEPPFGNCSRACGYGAIPVQNAGDFVCCWICKPCGKRQVSNSNQTQCSECNKRERADIDSGQCLALRVEAITDRHRFVLTIQRYLIYAEFVGVFAVFILLFRFRNTTILRSSGLEQWFGIMICILFTLTGAFGYTLEPSHVACVLRSMVAPTFSLAIYVFMFTKAVRISMSFRGTKNSGIIYDMLPKSLASYHLSIIYVGIPLLLVIVFLSYSMAKNFVLVDYRVHEKLGFMTTHCSYSSHFFMHLPNIPFGLLAVGQLQRVWNLPHNFSETKDLLVATAISCLFTTLAFCLYVIPTRYVYLRELASSWFLVCNALWFMVVLFVRKIYYACALRNTSKQNHNTKTTNVSAVRARSFSANTSGKIQSVNKAEVFQLASAPPIPSAPPLETGLQMHLYANAGSPPLTNYLTEEARL